jgi:hypothetical protein
MAPEWMFGVPDVFCSNSQHSTHYFPEQMKETKSIEYTEFLALHQKQ